MWKLLWSRTVLSTTTQHVHLFGRELRLNQHAQVFSQTSIFSSTQNHKQEFSYTELSAFLSLINQVRLKEEDRQHNFRTITLFPAREEQIFNH